MSKRLTRKQIREDIRHGDVQTALTTTFEKVLANTPLVLGTIVGIVVLAVGFAGGRAYLTHRQEAAAGELAKATRIFDAPIEEEGAKPDDPAEPSFASEDARRARAKEAMEAVQGGDAKDVAQLYLASIALREGDKAAARSHWQDYLRDHDDDDILAVSVRLDLIRLDRDEGKGEEVVAELEAELESADKSLPEDAILYELARTLETLDRGEEAQEYYQRILDDHPQSPYAAAAREKTSS